MHPLNSVMAVPALDSRQLRCPGSQRAPTHKAQVLRGRTALDRPTLCAPALSSCRQSTPSRVGRSAVGQQQAAWSSQGGRCPADTQPTHTGRAPPQRQTARAQDSLGISVSLQVQPYAHVRAHESHAVAWKGHAVRACVCVQAQHLTFCSAPTLESCSVHACSKGTHRE